MNKLPDSAVFERFFTSDDTNVTNVTERSEVTQVSPTMEQTGRCY